MIHDSAIDIILPFCKGSNPGALSGAFRQATLSLPKVSPMIYHQSLKEKPNIICPNVFIIIVYLERPHICPSITGSRPLGYKETVSVEKHLVQSVCIKKQ